jgi:hypothetical protein
MQDFINAGYFDEDIIKDNTNFDIIGAPKTTTGTEVTEPTEDGSDEELDESETANDYSAAHLVEVIEKDGIFTCSEE